MPHRLRGMEHGDFGENLFNPHFWAKNSALCKLPSFSNAIPIIKRKIQGIVIVKKQTRD
jgi:hypothetical protein